MLKYKHEEVIRAACEAAPQVDNLVQLAKRLDMRRKTLENHLVQVVSPQENETTFDAFQKYAAAVDINTDKLADEHELRYFKQRCKMLEKALVSEKVWKKTFLDVAGMLRSDPVPVPEPPGDVGGKSHHIAMLNCTDWHYGAWETHGLGVLPWYTVEIANKAIDALFSRTVKLLKRLEYVIVDALIINFLGDIVENVIMREGQRRRTEMGVAEQVVQVAYRIAQNIKMVAREYPEVYVGGVPGNHGRTSRKKGVNDPWDSFDWLVYQFVKALCANQPNVHFMFPKTWYLFYVLYGEHVVYTMHGAEIRSYVGFPWYGYGRAISNIAGTMTEETKYRIRQLDFTNPDLPIETLLNLLALVPDTCVIGHFHQEAFFRMQGKNAIAANAMIPTTEFIAQSKHAMTRPSQTLSLFSKSWGRLVTNYPVWLDDVIRAESEDRMLTEPVMRVC